MIDVRLIAIIVFNCIMIILSLYITAAYANVIVAKKYANPDRMNVRASIASAIDTVIDNSRVLSTMRDNVKAYGESKRRRVLLPRPDEIS